MSSSNELKTNESTLKLEDLVNEIPDAFFGSEKLQGQIIKFLHRTTPRTFSSLADLKLAYAEVSKADLFSVVTVCARLMCVAAQVAYMNAY